MTKTDACQGDQVVQLGSYCVTTHRDTHRAAVVDRSSTTSAGESFFTALHRDAFIQLPRATAFRVVYGGMPVTHNTRVLIDYLAQWANLCRLSTESVVLQDHCACVTVDESIAMWMAHGDVVDVRVASPRQWKEELRAGALAVGGTLDERRLNQSMWRQLRRDIQEALTALRAVHIDGGGIGPEEDAAYKRLGNLAGLWLREARKADQSQVASLRRVLQSLDALLPRIAVIGID